MQRAFSRAWDTQERTEEGLRRSKSMNSTTARSLTVSP
jgi:hypothetical protein